MNKNKTRQVTMSESYWDIYDELIKKKGLKKLENYLISLIDEGKL